MLFDHRWSRFVSAGSLVLGIALFPQSTTAETTNVAPRHPEGTLKLSERQLVPGSTIDLGGENFGAGSRLELILVGVAGEFVLDTVTTDSVGGFARSIEVPKDLNLGAYRIIAVASDGDEVASLNVEILAAAPMAPDHSGDLGHDEEGAPDEPTADHMDLERAGSPLVTGGAILGIVAALGGGVTLLRNRKHAV